MTTRKKGGTVVGSKGERRGIRTMPPPPPPAFDVCEPERPVGLIPDPYGIDPRKDPRLVTHYQKAPSTDQKAPSPSTDQKAPSPSTDQKAEQPSHVPDSDVSQVPDDRITGGSVGTELQLMAVGPQNYFLDLNPQVTLFKAPYQHHTPGATETFEDSFELVFGQAVVVEVQRRGDMMSDVFLEISLPNLGIAGGRWADAIGYVLFTRIRLLVDDVVVHDQERLWYDLVDRLFVPHGRRACVEALIGRNRVLSTSRAHTVLVPLKLCCCAAAGSDRPALLPLAALKRESRVRLEITAESLAACLDLPSGASVPSVARVAARVLSDQTFVEDDEKRQLLHAAHDILITQEQDADALSYTFDDAGVYDSATAAVDLREINLPVKALVFVAYDETAAGRKRYFEYLDCAEEATVLFGSGQRFAPRKGTYFSAVQPYQHCTSSQPGNVYCYSFARDAGARQPSGALNFAVVEKPVLRVGLQNTRNKPVKLKVFAMCNNWIVIQQGSLTMKFT